MTSIGIFGGTFDPIHLGHLRTAFELLHGLGFAEIRFVPCRVPPHRDRPVASVERRLEMVRVAVSGQPGFVVDERELARNGPSFSVDTLGDMREEYPDRSVALIVGMDAFLGLPGWHRWQEILDLGHVVVAHRPGWQPPQDGALGDLLRHRGTQDVADLAADTAGRIIVQPVTQLEISSSAIRESVSRGEDPRFLVTDEVRQIILESGCYAE